MQVHRCASTYEGGIPGIACHSCSLPRPAWRSQMCCTNSLQRLCEHRQTDSGSTSSSRMGDAHFSYIRVAVSTLDGVVACLNEGVVAVCRSPPSPVPPQAASTLAPPPLVVHGKVSPPGAQAGRCQRCRCCPCWRQTMSGAARGGWWAAGALAGRGGAAGRRAVNASGAGRQPRLGRAA